MGDKQTYKDSLSRPGRGVAGLDTKVGGLGKESNLSYNAVKGTKYDEIDVDMSSMPKFLRKLLSLLPSPYKKIGYDNGKKVKRKYKNGGAVSSGRGGKFKGHF